MRFRLILYLVNLKNSVGRSSMIDRVFGHSKRTLGDHTFTISGAFELFHNVHLNIPKRF